MNNYINLPNTNLLKGYDCLLFLIFLHKILMEEY